MSLGLGKALIDDAKEWTAEEEKRKSLAKRRTSGKDVTPLPLSSTVSPPDASAGPESAITTGSISPQKNIANDEPSGPQVASPKPPVETAASFAHRRKLSEEAFSRQSAMSSVYGSHKIRLPGDLGTGDPRRLPGDLGPNDPRRAPSPVPASKSQSPSGRRAVGTPSKTARPRRASDGALLRPKKKRENSDDATARLAEDRNSASSDSDSDSDSDNQRGRGRDRSSRNSSVVESESEESGADRRRSNNPPQSPSITVTPPAAGAEQHTKKKAVHPHSAYDHSAASTPRNSDDEEQLSDLRRAQKLALTISRVHSTPSAHRAIRQIIRGDYAHLQREAEAGRRRQRVYLVATDLSPEAEYALEWTIGTVLRDGDTLLALYAVDEEGGTGGDGVEIGHGADVIKDTAKIVGSLPSEKAAQSPARSPLGARMGEDSQSRPPLGTTPTDKTRAETERIKAAEAISERVVKLLRKTRLQIRVVVEVFHCKSPKHMITEVIDFLSPTMTILGSRGRSALKGVLLGSFSNYIVTKSSVPVMVARRRLKKHTKQRLHKDGLPVAGTGDGRMRIGRMSNVLEAPSGAGKRINRLSVAKVD